MTDTDRLAAAFGVPDLEASLDDWLGAVVPVAPESPMFGPDGDHESTTAERILPAPDEDVADRLLGRARRLDVEAANVHELAARRVEEIRAWEADLTGGIAQDRERVGESLELFAREVHRAQPKRKSMQLVNGTLQLRASGRGRVDVTDEHALIRWCEEHERKDLLRYQPEPNKGALGEVEDRRTRPQETIVDPKHGPELYHVWGILVEALVNPEAQDGEVMTAEVPGVRWVERAQDRFTFKTADELAAAAAAKEEPEA